MPSRDVSLGTVFGEVEPTRSSRRLALLHGRLRERLLGRSEPPPARVGRFELIERIGAGGMSTVYLARDPALDRRVAIKLLRVDGLDAAQTLVAEARTLAKLEHPNIIEVFDVGTDVSPRDGAPPTVFIAMEFVAGQDLAHWLRTRPPWRDALDALLAAGRGLAGAHASGVVHGDFKPANVLRGNDGQIKVIDFGLSRLVEELGDSHEGSSPMSLPRKARRGGTPGYCAPEKFHGDNDGPRSDQFSFCVSAFEAVFRRRPFAAHSPAAFLDEVAVGPPAATRRGVFGKIGEVLQRGMDDDPAQRWPDMLSVIEALDSILEGYPRRRVWVAGGVAMAVVVGLGWSSTTTTDGIDCTTVGETTERTWFDTQREAVSSRFTADASHYLVEGGPKVIKAVDQYVGDLSEAQRTTCEARASKDLSAVIADQQVACLHERERSLRRLLDGIHHDDGDLAKVITGVYRLPRVSTCAGLPLDQRGSELPSDPYDRARAEEIQRRNEELKATLSEARYVEGVEEAKRLLSAAESLGYEPARVSSLNTLAAFTSRLGDLETAQALYEAAYFGSQRQQMDGLSLKIATNLIHAHMSRGQFDEALNWARHAEAVVHRAPDPIVVTKLYYAKAVVFQEIGRNDEARDLLSEIVETRTSILGRDHPTTASAVFELGNVQMATGEYERALQSFDEALRGYEGAFGSGHPTLANVYNNKGNLLTYLDRDDEAKSSWARALEIREEVLGPNHIALGGTLTNLASAANSRSESELAMAYAQRAMTIREAALGPSHPSLIGTLTQLAEAQLRRDRPDLARSSFERAIEIGDGAFEGFHSTMVQPLAGAARAAWAMGDADATVRHATRLVEREEPPLADPRNAADALWVMAQAQWATGAHDESKRMAGYAVQAYGDSGNDDLAETVAAWMKDRDA